MLGCIGARADRRRFALLASELDSEIASFVSRDASMQQRATILVGAASVVGALQVGTSFDWATVASLVLSFIAAVSGVVVIFPRTGDALDVRALRDGLVSMAPEDGAAKLIDTKLEILEADEKWLSRRGWFARVGFISLSLSIAVATIAVLLPGPETDPAMVDVLVGVFYGN